MTGVLLAKPPEAVPAFGVDSTTALTVVTTLRANNEPTFENPRREAIYDVIAESPGRYTAGVAALTGISASTVRYHVRVLEDAGLIQSMMIRGKRRFHLPELEREVVRIEAALADESTGPVLDAVARLEPVDVSSVAAEVDVARSTASYHLQQLEADDLVARERTGQTVVTRLDPAVRTYLEDGEGSGPAGSDEPAG